MWPQDPDPDDNWLAPQRKDELFDALLVAVGALCLVCFGLVTAALCILRWW